MSCISEAKNLLEDKKTTFSLLLDTLCELEREHGALKAAIKLDLNEDNGDETLRRIIEIIVTTDRIKSRIEERVYELAESKLKINNSLKLKGTSFWRLLDELCELEHKYGSLRVKVGLGFRVGFSSCFSVGFKENLQALSEIPIAADKIKARIKRRVKELANTK